MANGFGFWAIVSVSAIVLVSVFSAVKRRSSPSSRQTGVSPSQSAASSREMPPPSLDEVKDQLEAVIDASNVDELIKIIRDLLQWRITRNAVDDKGESSESVASRLIGSGEAIFKILNDPAEKSSNTGDIVSSAPQIIEDVLDKLMNVHWLVAGLSVIGYMVRTADETSENYKSCLDRLQKLVDLSDHMKILDLQDQEEKVKGDIVMIVYGCILCASHMSLHKLSSYFEVSDQDLRSFDREINLTLTIVKRRAGMLAPRIPLARIPYLSKDGITSH